jgi:hypothetical protein
VKVFSNGYHGTRQIFVVEVQVAEGLDRSSSARRLEVVEPQGQVKVIWMTTLIAGSHWQKANPDPPVISQAQTPLTFLSILVSFLLLSLTSLNSFSSLANLSKSSCCVNASANCPCASNNPANALSSSVFSCCPSDPSTLCSESITRSRDCAASACAH